MKPKNNQTWLDLENEFTDFLWNNAEATTTYDGQRQDQNKIPQPHIEHMINSLFGLLTKHQ